MTSTRTNHGALIPMSIPSRDIRPGDYVVVEFPEPIALHVRSVSELSVVVDLGYGRGVSLDWIVGHEPTHELEVLSHGSDIVTLRSTRDGTEIEVVEPRREYDEDGWYVAYDELRIGGVRLDEKLTEWWHDPVRHCLREHVL